MNILYEVYINDKINELFRSKFINVYNFKLEFEKEEKSALFKALFNLYSSFEYKLSNKSCFLEV